ncbi:MAG: response regulator [Lentisphaerae bacterium]|nr:response regulator [Lentisphaerota bacterium]
MTGERRILLVDDDREFVQATRDLLEAYGYAVDAAHSGAEGLQKARAQRPDLMILDVMMSSETEGFDISRRVQEEPELQDLPVIMLTGIRKAMNLPFQFEPDKQWLPVKAVLEKPVSPDRLLAEIKKHLKSA